MYHPGHRARPALVLESPTMEPGGPYGGRERRAAERYRVNFEAVWAYDSTQHEATVVELSMGGCLLDTDATAPLGALVRVEIRLPVSGLITLWGNVIYHNEGLGFAIQFSPFLHSDDRQKLEWLVAAEARRNKAAGQETPPAQ